MTDDIWAGYDLDAVIAGMNAAGAIIPFVARHFILPPLAM